MILKEKNVLLCKAAVDSDGEPDLYEEDLQNNGYSVTVIPAIDFKYHTNAENTLDNSENYSGIVFTSPRSVIGFSQAINSNLTWFNNSNLQIYVVGRGTSLLVEKKFKLKSVGEEYGNANILADLIISHKQNHAFEKPLLFPCGNLKMDILPNKLEKENIPLAPFEVYETIPNVHFEEKFSKLTKFGTECPEFIVFFSPSGIAASIPLFEKFHIDMEKIKFVAIGPTTEKAMIDKNINVAHVSKKPTPEALTEAIKSIHDSAQN